MSSLQAKKELRDLVAALGHKVTSRSGTNVDGGNYRLVCPDCDQEWYLRLSKGHGKKVNATFPRLGERCRARTKEPKSEP